MQKSVNLMLLLALLGVAEASAATVWQESFETDGQGSRYTASTPFNDGASDHWNRTDGSDISNATGGYTAFDGTYFWAAEDTDDNGGNGADEQTLEITGIDISSYTGLTFKGLFGAGNENAAGASAYDSADYIQVAYSVDGGAVTNGVCFAYENSGDAYNEPLGLDADCDGVADANGVNRLGTAMQEFSFAIPDGSSLSLSIRVYMDSSSEEIAFDNLRIEDGSATSSSSSEASSSSSSVSTSSSSSSSVSSSSSSGAFDMIHDIQGNGAASPMQGATVTIEGIVVGDFQTGMSGFFVQEEDADADADTDTSEGIFVYSTTAVSEGDKVQVTGTVTEYNDLTEISPASSVVIVSSGNALPTAASPRLPQTVAGELERYEGMLVDFSQTLYVTEHYNLARYGQVKLSSGGRLDQPTNVAAPGTGANTLAAANLLNYVFIDDADSAQNPDPIIFSNNAPNALSATDTLRGGDTITNLTGVLGYSFSEYVIYPTPTVPYFVNANARPSTAPAVSGSLTVAAFNVLNYFTTVDGGSAICGPLTNQDCRGADSSAELTRQEDKLLAALSKLDADVIGLMELENTNQTAIANLAASLSGYDYIANPAGDGVELGDDAITVGVLYKTSTVTPVGSAQTVPAGFGSIDLGAACGSSSDGVYPFDDLNRKPLAVTFEETATGGVFTVVVNHFKSKGSLSGYSDDNDQSDGQGNNNCTRTKASDILLEWLATDPTSSGDTDFIIMGDLNAYAMEDPIMALTAAGYTNQVTGYSYVYNGQWGSLDHILTSASLSTQVADGAKWHINADEPRALDYNEEYKSAGQLTSLYGADEFRTSDHDPVMISLNLGSTASGSGPVDFDFNADGKGDILWRDPSTYKMFMTFMNGTSKDSEGYVTTSSWDVIGIAEFDGDDKGDILWRDPSNNKMFMTFMDGLSKKTEGFVTISSWDILALHDFDGDAKADILWRDPSTNNLYMSFMDGKTKKTEGYVTTSSWDVIGVADFDADGKGDILWRDPSTNNLYMSFMDGKTKTSEGYVTTSTWDILALADFDGDSKADILWRDPSTNKLFMSFMDGKTKASEAFVTISTWDVLSVSDFDADGKADILWRDASTNNIYMSLMDGATQVSGAYITTSAWDVLSTK